jgi:hypothetical protein
MEMGTLGIVALTLGALPLLPLALVASYRLGRRQRRAEVVVALMDDDAFVRDMGALDRVRDQIRERNTRYAQWRRQQAREFDAATEAGTASAGAGNEERRGQCER